MDRRNAITFGVLGAVVISSRASTEAVAKDRVLPGDGSIESDPKAGVNFWAGKAPGGEFEESGNSIGNAKIAGKPRSSLPRSLDYRGAETRFI